MQFVIGFLMAASIFLLYNFGRFDVLWSSGCVFIFGFICCFAFSKFADWCRAYIGSPIMIYILVEVIIWAGNTLAVLFFGKPFIISIVSSVLLLGWTLFWALGAYKEKRYNERLESGEVIDYGNGITLSKPKPNSENKNRL